MSSLQTKLTLKSVAQNRAPLPVLGSSKTALLAATAAAAPRRRDYHAKTPVPRETLPQADPKAAQASADEVSKSLMPFACP